MTKLLKAMLLSLALCCLCSVSARAMENDMLKVGVKYGSDAMFSANLQNYDGAGLGYAFGYYSSARELVSRGAVREEGKSSVAGDTSVGSCGTSD